MWKNEQAGNIVIQITGAGTIELVGNTNVTGVFANSMVSLDAGQWTITDNSTVAWVVGTGDGSYIEITTLNGFESINFGNATTSPAIHFVGDGLFTHSGNVTIDILGATDAILTMDGSSSSPGTLRYESDNERFVLDQSLNVDDTTTITTSRAALSGFITAIPSGASGAFYRGIFGQATVLNPAFDITGRLIGLEGDVSYVDITTGITMNAVYGTRSVYAITLANAGASISEVIGVDIAPIMIIAAGTVTDHIGLNIKNITGATNNWSIFSAGGNMAHVGNVRLGDTTTPVHKLEIKADSIVVVDSQSPASNGTGTQGEMAWDASYVYVCTATDTWKRSALTGGY